VSEDQSNLLKITDKVADLVHKLAGPMADEVGIMLGDKVRVYRVKNWIKTVQKTESMLREARLPVNAVPPRLLLPIVESCSIEDDETLQDMWAGLLASATQDTSAVPPSYVETLKRLSPDEARFLERLCKDSNLIQHYRGRGLAPFTFTEAGGAPHKTVSDTFEQLGLIRRDYAVNLQFPSSRLRNATSIDDALSAVQGMEPEIRFRFMLSEYAVEFLAACRGPQRETPREGNI